MTNLIIHPKDPTSAFMSVIYEDMPNYTLVDKFIGISELRSLIESHDRVVMVGHGSPNGLFDIERGGYLIDSRYVDVLKEKTDNIYIWCNADVFVERYDLKGFYTGMIISEVCEALYCNVTPSDLMVMESNEMFAKSIHEGIKYTPQLIVESVNKTYDTIGNDVVDYNKVNIYHR